jgi:hypothetical protein
MRERREIHRGLRLVNLKEKYNLEDLGLDGRIIFKYLNLNRTGGYGLNSCGLG